MDGYRNFLEIILKTLTSLVVCVLVVFALSTTVFAADAGETIIMQDGTEVQGGVVPMNKQTETATEGKLTTLSGMPIFEGGQASVSNVVNDLFLLLVAIGAVVAVLKIAVAGITFMLSESFTNRTAAKESIQNSLLGLAIVLSVVLILNVINPDLVRTNILDGVPSAPRFQSESSPIEQFRENAQNTRSTPDADNPGTFLTATEAMARCKQLSEETGVRHLPTTVGIDNTETNIPGDTINAFRCEPQDK